MRRIIPLVLTVAWISAMPASAATTEVTVNDNFFAPNHAPVAVGDAVHWSRAGDSVRPHSVTANQGFWDTGDPSPGPIDLTATLSAGTFHYFCKLHGSPDGDPSSGMNGYVSVPVSTSRAPSGLPFTVIWATPATTTGTQFDVQYRVGQGRWKRWKSATASFKGVFGKRGKPVALHRGTSYSLRARSRTSQGPSGWSPTAKFKP
jgi:plastocyanin